MIFGLRKLITIIFGLIKSTESPEYEYEYKYLKTESFAHLWHEAARSLVCNNGTHSTRIAHTQHYLVESRGNSPVAWDSSSSWDSSSVWMERDRDRRPPEHPPCTWLCTNNRTIAYLHNCTRLATQKPPFTQKMPWSQPNQFLSDPGIPGVQSMQAKTLALVADEFRDFTWKSFLYDMKAGTLKFLPHPPHLP